MTGKTLRNLREARNLTREQLAAELGDCTHSTVNKWERDMHPIPKWVEEKMLRGAKVELPLADLQALLNYCVENGKNFEVIIAAALREYIDRQGVVTDPEITHRTIKAAGRDLTLLEATKESPNLPSENPAVNLSACTLPAAAKPATSTVTGPKGRPLPKKGADIVLLPTSHWSHPESARVAEEKAPPAARKKRRSGNGGES
jgi:transcriptional regulator with XRE-family HTH domain